VWLAPGVGHGDTYVCKECGLSFVVNKTASHASQLHAEISQPEEADS
jgi:hypothetical protein